MDFLTPSYIVAATLFIAALPVSVLMGMRTNQQEMSGKTLVGGICLKGFLFIGILVAFWQVGKEPPAPSDIVGLSAGMIIIEFLRALLSKPSPQKTP